MNFFMAPLGQKWSQSALSYGIDSSSLRAGSLVNSDPSEPVWKQEESDLQLWVL